MAARTTLKSGYGYGARGASGRSRPAALRSASPAKPVNPAKPARSRTRRKENSRPEAIPAIADRVLVLWLLLGVAFVALGVRLFWIQVVQHPALVREAHEIRKKAIRLPARRGELYDRNGTKLVENKPAFAIGLDPNVWFANENAKAGDTAEDQKQRAIHGLSGILSEVNVAGIVAKRGIKRGTSGRYRTIEIAPVVSEKIGEEIRKANLPGVSIIPTAERVALDGELAAHVLGFTRRDGVGAAGIEYALDRALTGEHGVIAGEFDSRNRPIPGTVRQEKPALHGEDIALTLDSDIQHITQEALLRAYQKSRAASATAVVMDPKTGDVLALANYPAYDANKRSDVPPDAWANRAVTTPFEPGSTMKAFTVAAILEEHKVSPGVTFYCNGVRQIGKKRIHCHGGERHGTQSLTQVMTNSCNIATAQCAFDLGKNRLYDYFKLFGFGEKTGSDLPGESRGIFNHPDAWSDMRLANIAFGQGISVTALQMAAAYGAIANDGVWMRPRIVRGVRHPDLTIEEKTPEPGRRVLSAATAREIRTMLQAVVDEGTGTSAQLVGYTAGGKTGTAQIAENGRYRGKHLASFVGMAPIQNPRYVILVAVTDPKGEYYGGQVAAPVFKEIAECALVAARVPRDKAPTVQKGKRTTSRD
ncbi:MAG: stage V sporulation protein D [Armatimonadaceae bacterium]